MTDVTTTPNERYGLKARRYPSWSPRTADSALRYPSSPAGVAAARKRLLFASSPAPSFELPDSPVQDTPARRRHPLSAFAHPRYEDRVPHEVIDAFAFYDANHSGFLDYLELRAALRGYGYDASIDECIELLRQYDDDLDGRLSLNEFCALVIDLARHEQDAWLSAPYVPSDLRTCFELSDTNGSGYLDYLELQRALLTFGYDASVDESIDLLRQYDDRFEGRLDLPSFAALVDDLLLASHRGWRLGGALSSDGALPLPPARYVAPPHPTAVLPQRTYVPPLPAPDFIPAPLTVQHVPFGGRMVPVAPSLAYSSAAGGGLPLPSPPRISYLRPLASATVRMAFERFDEMGHGVLDTLRCRDALVFLGARLSHGEVASLLRRHGGYVPEHVDAVCSLPQFGAIVNHLRDGGLPVNNPFLATHQSDIHPHTLGAQAAAVSASDAASASSAAAFSARRWYGFVPYPGRPGSAQPDFSFKPCISPASGRPSLLYP